MGRVLPISMRRSGLLYLLPKPPRTRSSAGSIAHWAIPWTRRPCASAWKASGSASRRRSTEAPNILAGSWSVRSQNGPARSRRAACRWIEHLLIAQILADKTLDRAERISSISPDILALRCFLLCCGFFLLRHGFFLLGRGFFLLCHVFFLLCRGFALLGCWHLFRDHHRPESFVPSLIIAGDCEPDAVGPSLKEVRIVAGRILPHTKRLFPIVSAGRNIFSSHTGLHARHPRGERSGYAVVHCAGSCHSLGLAFGNRRELRVCLDAG